MTTDTGAGSASREVAQRDAQRSNQPAMLPDRETQPVHYRMHAMHDDPSAGASVPQMPGQPGGTVEHEPSVTQQLDARERAGVGDVVGWVTALPQRPIGCGRDLVPRVDPADQLLDLATLRTRRAAQGGADIGLGERKQRCLRTHVAPPTVRGPGATSSPRRPGPRSGSHRMRVRRRRRPRPGGTPRRSLPWWRRS